MSENDFAALALDLPVGAGYASSRAYEEARRTRASEDALREALLTTVAWLELPAISPRLGPKLAGAAMNLVAAMRAALKGGKS